ncbi:MAG: hypothetical protein JW811_03115 [Clostridiales bacterium]|nr:hypothetical protein [Clostridiales bacterium]
MKKLIILFLLFLLVCPVSSLAADRALPDEILEAFQTPEWEGYTIPAIPEGEQFAGLLASYYYDENNRAAAIAIMKKDEVNTLCILEKERGAWIIVAQSSTAIKQGDEIPFISAEMYDQFDIYYHRLREDGQPYLGITVRKVNGQWVVPEISYFPDDVYVYADIGKNELRYAGEKTDWEQIVIKGHIENSLDLFVLDDFPLTIEAAQEIFTGDSGE